MRIDMTGTCVSRSIYIDRKPEKVIDYISDFGTWAKWSPWLILEPKSEVTFSTFQQQPGLNTHGKESVLVQEKWS
ncbi:TPA: SRPBCC family protein [Vibrio vulnificus]